MIKKSISSLMVLTLVVLFALTWYCSYKTEQLVTTQIALLNQSSPELIQIELENYRRKLFTSQAATTVYFRGKAAVHLQHRLRHFIWGVKMITALAADSALARKITAPIPLDQLQLTTSFDLQGASQSELELAQFNFRDDRHTVETTGFRGNWNINGDLTTGNLSCQFDELQLQLGNLGNLDLTDLKFSGKMTALHDIHRRKVELLLEKIQLSGQKMVDIEIRGIQYHGQIDLTQELVSSAAKLNFAELLLARETFRNGRLKWVLSGIDAQLLHSLQQTAKQLTLGQQSNPLERQLQLLGLYTRLLESGVTLTLEDLSLDSDNNDKLRCRGTLALLKKPRTKSSLFSLKNIEANFEMDMDRGMFITGYQLVNNLQARGKIYQNQAVLAEQAEQLAGGLVQKEILVRQNGDKFHIDFSISNSQAQLNGKPILEDHD